MTLQQKAEEVINVLQKLYPKAETVLKYSNGWELLVAVILSAMCTDKAVNKTTDTLFPKYPTLQDYLNADPEEFAQDLSGINFYKSKAKNILKTAHIIAEKYRGEIPQSMEEMVELPGVARKTANIVLGLTHGIIVGIPVDTHVKRLSKLLGFTKQTDPVKIEQDLMQIIPQKEWLDITFRLVQYGRDYCPARAHDHTKCPLAKYYV